MGILQASSSSSSSSSTVPQPPPDPPMPSPKTTTVLRLNQLQPGTLYEIKVSPLENPGIPMLARRLTDMAPLKALFRQSDGNSNENENNENSHGTCGYRYGRRYLWEYLSDLQFRLWPPASEAPSVAPAAAAQDVHLTIRRSGQRDMELLLTTMAGDGGDDGGGDGDDGVSASQQEQQVLLPNYDPDSPSWEACVVIDEAVV